MHVTAVTTTSVEDIICPNLDPQNTLTYTQNILTYIRGVLWAFSNEFSGAPAPAPHSDPPQGPGTRASCARTRLH